MVYVLLFVQAFKDSILEVSISIAIKVLYSINRLSSIVLYVNFMARIIKIILSIDIN